MRKPSPTTLALAVAIALFAQAADAQTRGGANAGRATAGVNASAPSNAPGTGTISNANGGIVFGNNSQGSGTINSGQSGNVATLVSTNQGNVIAVGTPVAGAGGTNPSPNASQGQTSPGATGNNATGTNQGQTSGTGAGITSQGVTPSSIQNLQGAQLVDTQGRVLTNVNGVPLALDSRGVIGISPLGGAGPDVGVAGDMGAAGTGNAQVVVLNAGDLAGFTSTPELDRATRKELEKAKIASRSRNKQLLNTIAPRTNVDRTDQMADDPPSPALSTPERSLPRY